MIKEQNEQGNGWTIVISGLMLQFLALIARINVSEKTEITTDLNDRIDRAVMEIVIFLESNFRKPINRKMMSQYVHLSEGYLSRCFSQKTGIGIIEFVNRLRIEEACRLLRQTDLSMYEIAENVGYSDPAYFSRIFKKVLGLSPCKYRMASSTPV